MSEGVQQYPCSICGQGGHRPSHCKELAPPSPDGFYKPAPGGHQHDEDDDDERIMEVLNFYRVWYRLNRDGIATPESSGTRMF